MSEIVMSTEAEVEDFTDELSDEALDRAEGALAACSVFPPGRLKGDVPLFVENSSASMLSF